MFWVYWIAEVGAIDVDGCVKIIEGGATDVDGCVEINFGFHYGNSSSSSILTFINHHSCWTMEEEVMCSHVGKRRREKEIVREEREGGDLFSFYFIFYKSGSYI